MIGDSIKDGAVVNVGYHFDIVYSLDQIKDSKKGKLLYHNMPSEPEVFIKDLFEYENKYNKRNFKNSNYEARYGMTMELLLPLGEWSKNDLLKVASRFAKEVIGKEVGLKYAVWYEKRGKGNFLFFYFADREYYPHTVRRVYPRDFLLNRNTGALAKASDPDAVVVHKKGDPICDKDGNPIVYDVLFKDNKSRRFIWNKSHFAYVQQILHLFVECCEKVKKKVKQGMFFMRLNLRKAFNRFAKRGIIANNTTRQIIQNELNIRYWKSLRDPNAYEIYKEGYVNSEKIETTLSKQIREMFEEYRTIFKQGYFEDENEKRTIQYSQRIDVVESNLEELLNRFFNRVKTLDAALSSALSK